jgi:hypothetical protein
LNKGEFMSVKVAEMAEEPSAESAPEKTIATDKDICDQVMVLLGRPPNFHQCTAARVSDTNFRVNVWDKEEYSSGKITDSFFVKVNDEGKISSSSPDIKRRYPSITKA